MLQLKVNCQCHKVFTDGPSGLHPRTAIMNVQFVSVTIFLQEGFILGESKIEEQVTINDSQADHIQIEEIYSELYLYKN